MFPKSLHYSQKLNFTKLPIIDYYLILKQFRCYNSSRTFAFKLTGNLLLKTSSFSRRSSVIIALNPECNPNQSSKNDYRIYLQNSAI